MKEFIKFILFLGGVLALILGLVKFFFVDTILVEDDRMAPTMIAGEQVFLWRGADPELGDIVVCAHPTVDGELVMGRIVGDHEHQVTAMRGNMMIAGRGPDRNWLGTFSYEDPASGQIVPMKWGVETVTEHEHPFMMRRDFQFTMRPIRIMEGQIYLVNDLRSMSTQDSRSYGVVDPTTCLGVVFMRFKPAADRQQDPPLDHGWLDILR